MTNYLVDRVSAGRILKNLPLRSHWLAFIFNASSHLRSDLAVPIVSSVAVVLSNCAACMALAAARQADASRRDGVDSAFVFLFSYRE